MPIATAPGAIVELASRRMRLTINVDEKLVEDVARVLRQERPNLSHQQSLDDASQLLIGINAALEAQAVPAGVAGENKGWSGCTFPDCHCTIERGTPICEVK